MGEIRQQIVRAFAQGFRHRQWHYAGQVGKAGMCRQASGGNSKRAARYHDAGADGVFVPGLSELPAIKAIVREVKMPVNVMAYPGLLPAKELGKLGVKRLSSGTAVPQMIWSRVAELAKNFLVSGDSKPLFNNSMAYGTLQKLFTR